MAEAQLRFLERLPLCRDRPLVAYGATTLLIAAGFLTRYAADGVLPPGFPFVTFFPVVIVAAFLFGLGPGSYAGVACGLLSWFFFVAPNGFSLAGGAGLAMLFYVFVVFTDVALNHLMQRANARLAAERERSRLLAENRALLFSELQHRVSNNLQVVAALLTLQKRDVDDARARHALDEAGRRLALIGKIHRQLHDPDGGRRGMGDFLAELCADVVDAAGRGDVVVEVRADRGVALDPDSAIPLALIVTEAVSNAIEHGFPDRAGRIEVLLDQSDKGVELRVVDNGRGVPDGFSVEDGDNLGLRIARLLARQLGGEFTLSRSEGACARLLLPAR